MPKNKTDSKGKITEKFLFTGEVEPIYANDNYVYKRETVVHSFYAEKRVKNNKESFYLYESANRKTGKRELVKTFQATKETKYKFPKNTEEFMFQNWYKKNHAYKTIDEDMVRIYTNKTHNYKYGGIRLRPAITGIVKVSDTLDQLPSKEIVSFSGKSNIPEPDARNINRMKGELCDFAKAKYIDIMSRKKGIDVNKLLETNRYFAEIIRWQYIYYTIQGKNKVAQERFKGKLNQNRQRGRN